jgi:leucyl aminopeptidase
MIELSTLTGGMKSSLGLERAGLFTNNDSLVKKMELVSQVSEENFW